MHENFSYQTINFHFSKKNIKWIKNDDYDIDNFNDLKYIFDNKNIDKVK